MRQNIEAHIILLLGVLIGAFLLWNADRNDNVLEGLSNCIEREARTDGYKGTVEQRWATYSEWCANKN